METQTYATRLDRIVLIATLLALDEDTRHLRGRDDARRWELARPLLRRLAELRKLDVQDKVTNVDVETTIGASDATGDDGDVTDGDSDDFAHTARAMPPRSPRD